MSAWLVWLILAGVLAIAEVLSLDLVLIMCALAAGAAGASAALGLPVAAQLAVFALASVALLFGARPAAKRHMLSTRDTPMGIEALVGKTALVLRRVDAHDGLVKLHGEDWTARPYELGQVLQVGETVSVMEIKGATALVWKEP